MPQTDNINSATVLKAIGGRVLNVAVIVAGSTAGSINDCTTTGAAAVGNQHIVCANAVGQLSIPTPVNFGVGIVVVPGTGQTLSVMWE